MQERQRQRLRRGGVGPGPGDAAAVSGTVTVVHGTYSEELPVSGLTVSAVRTRFQDRLDIHPEATAVLDGDPVDGTAQVLAGQILTFVRPAGEKGAARW